MKSYKACASESETALRFLHQTGKPADCASQFLVRVHRGGAANVLHDELAKTLELIAQQPCIGAQARDLELSDVRRVLLPVTGYFVYYRVQLQRVEVLAIWHTHRGSSPII